jgi:1-acyl-sn-glycerol-3-phosphate acyltransferase
VAPKDPSDKGTGKPPPKRRAPAKPRAKKTAAAVAPAAPPVAEATPGPEPLVEGQAAAERLLTDEDDIPPDALPPDESWSDLFYGEETTPPPGDDGPGLDRRSDIPYTRKAATEEVRELERRIKARLTPAFPIEHRRRLPLEFLWKRVRDLAMRDRSDVVDEFGRDPMVAARIKPILDFFYDTYFRVEVAGLEHIPDTGRAIIVANHSGTLPYDGALLMHAVRREHAHKREVRPLVEDFVFHFPYLGTFINRIGGVRACQENAERLLDEDQVVAVFPEGIKGIGKLYKERYRLQRFGRGGFVKLALRTGAPIIPCAIVGAEEIHPMMGKITWLARTFGAPYLPITPTFPLLGPLGLVPLPTKWTIRFGPPLDYGRRFGPEAQADRILVNKLSESVRTIIQEMIDDKLAARKSVFFG